MEYVHIKSLEKYHPGYKDRKLQWCKAYFEMVNSNPEFEMLEEIDRWRYIAFIMLELQLRKPIPINKEWLARKGFNLKKRPISLTLQMLHNFLDIDTVSLHRVDKSRVDKSIYTVTTLPTLKEVSTYCTERANGVNPQRFIDFYTSKGWMIGKNKMKDWRAAVRTWENKDVKRKEWNTL